ncbi:MAG TPA: hypothetical protein VNK03_05000 [Gammaproteobacteria bacterium]|nr:hypothetical protein [Gammaproteobacteria bacterium]
MRKAKRELKRVAEQAKGLEPAVRHSVQKAVVKLQLDSERDWARDALTSAEQGLTEINATVRTALAIQAETTRRVEAVRDAGEQKHVSEQINIINATVTTLLNSQATIVAQEKIAREERSKVSSIPNEMENPTEGERQGKDACRKAQDAAKTIVNMLGNVRNDLSTIQAAQQAIPTLSQERKAASEQSQVVEVAQPEVPVVHPSAAAPPAYPEEGEGFVLVAVPETQNARLAELTRQRQAIEQAINAELAAGDGRGLNAPAPVTMLRDADRQNLQPAQNNAGTAVGARLANSGFLV